MRAVVVSLGALVAVGLWKLQAVVGNAVWILAAVGYAVYGLALLTALERSRRDPLTKLDNRRWAMEKMKDRNGPVLLIDLDHFKQINDRYGHPAGDRALRLVAQAIRHSVRRSDVVARWGGEEFVVFMPNASPGTARMVATRIAGEIRKVQVAPGWDLTASFGLALPNGRVPFSDDLLKRADQALYDAKKTRDCLVVC